MKNNDLEGISIEVKRINDKMMQALKLHTDIQLRRIDSIKTLDAQYFTKSEINPKLGKPLFEKLWIVHNDQKMLDKVIEPSILRTESILKDLTEGNMRKLKSDDKEMIKTMLKALELINEKIALEKKMMIKEEKYLTDPSYKTFGPYHSAWVDMNKSDIELLNKINPAHLNKISELINTNFEDATTKGALIGGIVGMIVPIASIFTGRESTEPITAQTVLICSFIGAILGAAAGMLLTYQRMTSKIVVKQREAVMNR